ncbi:hypothetical protein J6590_043443 [Homalodisca vitripennis]|nr:hypothetical protein J6590_043443 [Homalodisca vitripennis]
MNFNSRNKTTRTNTELVRNNSVTLAPHVDLLKRPISSISYSSSHPLMSWAQTVFQIISQVLFGLVARKSMEPKPYVPCLPPIARLSEHKRQS